MGQDPDVIRRQIEQTREHMGATVDALGYKADVPARAKDSVSEKVDSLKSRLVGAGSHVSEATPDGQELKQGAKQAVGVVQENPLGLAIGAAALGFLAGIAVPATKIENERLGPAADQVKAEARKTGEQALEHGKQLIQETAQTASQKGQEAVAEVKDEMQESAQTHAREMTESATQSAERVAQPTRQGGA